MERAGIVSQLSGMLAHEMLQPVTSILNFAGGLECASINGFKRTLPYVEHLKPSPKKLIGSQPSWNASAPIKNEDSRICLKASTALEAALKGLSTLINVWYTRVVIKHNPLIEVNKLNRTCAL